MRFRAFSPKQKQVLTWWCDPAARSREALICDGAVRSGKTICMGLSFFCWAMRTFQGQAFGLCGKTVTGLRRNLLGGLLPVLGELGFYWEEKVSKNLLTVRFGGRENTFYLFGGRDEFVCRARQSGVTLPILYKNFVTDSYQLLRARLCGASAVLLIAACLGKAECAGLIALAHSLGMEVLLEMHDERELEYAALGPDMCGVNNRNLGTFETSVGNSFRLAPLLPEGVIKVSESGISSPATVRELRRAGFSGFLIGESFMKCGEPGAALDRFIRGIDAPEAHTP